MNRKILAVVLAAAMAVGLMGGCSKGKSAGSASQSAGKPVSGGTLTISLSSSPKYLDPVKYTGTYESQIINSVADTLVNYNMDLSKIVPNLATSWTISSDGLTYDFKLRDDVYFQAGKYQNGRKMTAADIKYSLERSAKDSSMNRLSMLDHCDVVSDTEVKCVLKSANAVFLTALTDAGNVIVPKEEVEGWGDQFGNHLVGTGPFTLKQFTPDQQTDLVRNDKYWGNKAYLSGVTFKVITDPTQAVNALKTGAVDYATGLTGESVQLVQKDSTLKLLKTPQLHVAYVYMNMVNGPTKDIRVRKAILEAVNRDELLKGVYQYGEGTKAVLPLPAGSWGYDKSLESLVPSYNPADAKKLLSEAGYANGLTLNLYISNTPARVKMATILQEQLKTNLNITLNVHTSEWGTFSATAASGKADLYGMSWTWYPDPYFFLNQMFASDQIGALGNGAGFKDPTVDDLLNKALIETDQSKRAALYKQALKEIVQQDPQLVYSTEYNVGATNLKVQGLQQREDNSIRLCNSEVNVWKSK